MVLLLLSLHPYDDRVRSRVTSSGSCKTAVRCLPVAMNPVRSKHKPEEVNIKGSKLFGTLVNMLPV